LAGAKKYFHFCHADGRTEGTGRMGVRQGRADDFLKGVAQN